MNDSVIASSAGWPRPSGAHLRGVRIHLSLPALLLMAVSGGCGLAWQLVWTAGWGLALGHEIVAVLAVLGAFFAGLAAGAAWLAGRVERSARPGRWYAVAEAVVGVWGLAVTLLLPYLAPVLARWLGPQPSTALHALVAFGTPVLLLLPASAAMGITLPALERQLRGQARADLPGLYGANTLGAVAGVLLAVFVALPTWGVRATACGCALLNLACAAAAWAWAGRPVAVTDAGTHVARAAPVTRLGWQLAFTGLLGIGYEVLVVRVLAQVTENTVWTYAILLAIFLAGTAMGAAALRVFARGDDGARADRLLLALALAVLLSGAGLWWADALQALPARWIGASLASALAGEALVGVLGLVLPAMAMGALFATLGRQAQARGRPLGWALALNTLGAALAPALVGALLLPALGAKAVLLLIVLGYLALLAPAAWQRPTPAVVVAIVGAVAVVAPGLRLLDVPEGGRVLRHAEGALAAVSVVTDADDVARLHINNRVQEGSSAGGLVEVRLAQLPLLLHPAPREALFLGLGTGYTAHAAAADAGVHVTAVELVPEVIEASSLFMLRPTAPRAAAPVAVVAADARRFVQGDARRYDVIVADLFHPGRAGAGTLYTVEHFRAVRERLAPGGLFCQWLALHQMDLDTLRSIVAAFTQVYPDAVAMLAGNSLDTPVLGLVARPGAGTWRLADVQARLAGTGRSLEAPLRLARIDSAYAVLGAIVADAPALRRFAGDAVANTDDLPRVAHRAARTTYEPEAAPRARLMTLLDRLAGPAAGASVGDAAAERLAAYRRTRDAYLRLGLQLRPDPDPRVMLDRAGPGLLALLDASPEFTPAADALAGIAQSLQAADYPLSQQVLARVREAQARRASSAPSSDRQP